MIEAAGADLVAQADPDADADGPLAYYGENVQARPFRLNGRKIAEMDALVASLQMLGTLASDARNADRLRAL